MFTAGCCILCLSLRKKAVEVAQRMMFNYVVRKAVQASFQK